jgi:hypothetical protein
VDRQVPVLPLDAPTIHRKFIGDKSKLHACHTANDGSRNISLQRLPKGELGVGCKLQREFKARAAWDRDLHFLGSHRGRRKYLWNERRNIVTGWYTAFALEGLTDRFRHVMG